MSLKEQVLLDIERLPGPEFRQLAEYVAFLKFKSRRSRAPLPDEDSLARLYAEFADEDRELADDGMEDYVRSLAAEDIR